jgi:hypothetical protein
MIRPPSAFFLPTHHAFFDKFVGHESVESEKSFPGDAPTGLGANERSHRCRVDRGVILAVPKLAVAHAPGD